MKKIASSISAAAVYLSLALPAFAADTPLNTCATGQFSALCNYNNTKLGNVISTVVTVLLVGAAVISLFFLIYGGIRWITSGGDKSKVDSARQTIVASIIGLIIALLAYFIINIVLGFFNLKLSNLTLPTAF